MVSVCALSSDSRNATVQDLIISRVTGHGQHNIQNIYRFVHGLKKSVLRFWDTGLRNMRIPGAWYGFEAVVVQQLYFMARSLFTTDSYFSNMSCARGERKTFLIVSVSNSDGISDSLQPVKAIKQSLLAPKRFLVWVKTSIFAYHLNRWMKFYPTF